MRCGRTRWLALAALALVTVVYLANLPFYAGATFASGLSWRLEHGRLTLRNAAGREKPFWVDLNTEGLRWRPEWRRGPDSWSVTIPLWIPLGLCVAWCAASWRRRAVDAAAP
jgi:hypothetical protein